MTFPMNTDKFYLPKNLKRVEGFVVEDMPKTPPKEQVAKAVVNKVKANEAAAAGTESK